MGIPSWIYKWLNQDVVYWKKKGNDGEGGFEYEDPVELKCRLESKREQVTSGNGEIKVSRARIYTSQKVQEGGYMYFGTLKDSAIGDDQLPESTEGSMRILATDEVPNSDGRYFLYVAYTNMGSYER